MGSLIYCISLQSLNKIDSDKLKATAKAIRVEEGFSAQESNKMAVEQAIATLEKERDNIIRQIKGQLPEYWEKKEVAYEKPTGEKGQGEIREGTVPSTERRVDYAGGKAETKFPEIVSDRAGSYKSGVKTIVAPHDAAAFTHLNLSKYPQEHLATIILDKDRKIISVHRYSIGGPQSTQAHHSIMAGHALNTPEASSVILVHNHPSGKSKLSREDETTFNNLANTLKGTSVEASDIIAVGKDKFSSYMSETGEMLIPDVKADHEVPMVERVFKERGENLYNVTSPDDIPSFGKDNLPAGGLIFLNGANDIVGTLPIDDYSRVRGKVSEAILKQVDATNAVSIVPYKPDAEISREGKFNIQKFANAASLTLLDVVDKKGSGFELGTMPGTAKKEFFSTKPTKPQDTITVADIKEIFSKMKNILRFGQDKDGNFFFIPAGGRQRVTIKSVDHISGYIDTSAGRIPVGSYLKDIIKLKTGGKGPTADMVTLFHELGHYLEENDIITGNDINALNTAIAEAGGIRKDDVTKEQRADYIGDNLAEWKSLKNLRVKRILKKIADFMNAVYEFVARTRTARGVLRDVESGKILGEKGAAGINQFAQDVAFSLKQAISKITDNPNFVKWFGDSKVVDEEGKPLVVYHGTTIVGGFTKFDKNKIRITDYGYPFNGFWFLSDENTYPSMRKAQHIEAVYLSIKNPAPAKVWRKVASEVANDSKIRNDARSSGDEVRLRLIDNGYDGIHTDGNPDVNRKQFEETGSTEFRSVSGVKYRIRKDGEYTDLYKGHEYITGYGDFNDFMKSFGGREEWVAFNPTQIKSIFNTGAFGLTEPDIRYQMAWKKTIIQAISSAKTSRNIVATALKQIPVIKGAVNADIGGGKYDKGTNYLKDRGITNLVYDPYNRSTEYNNKVISHLSENRADTCTVANVLNTVNEKNIRLNIIRQAAKAIKSDGIAYFQVYNADGSGIGKETKKSETWQNNLDAKAYIEEVKNSFGSAKILKGHNNIIEATFPIRDNLASVWQIDEGMPLFQMAGKKAIGADKGALAKAQQMLADGVDKKKVWKETGWLKGAEKKDTWKFEIDDSGMKLKDFDDTSYRVPLEDILTHPKLYNAYPELKGIPFSVFTPATNQDSKGMYSKKEGILLNLEYMNEAEEIILHELQHIIQGVENFAPGGSPQTFANAKAQSLNNLDKTIENYNELLTRYSKEGNKEQYGIVIEKRNELSDKYRKIEATKSYDQYLKLAGEIESRDTSARAKLTAKQRSELYPYESQGIPEDQWIITDGKGTSFSVEETAESAKETPLFSTKPSTEETSEQYANRILKGVTEKIQKSSVKDLNVAPISAEKREAIEKELASRVIEVIGDFANPKHVKFTKSKKNFHRISNLIESPEFQFTSIPAAERVLGHSLKRREDAYELQRNMLEMGDRADLMKPLSELFKNNSVEHEKLVAFVRGSEKELSLQDLKDAKFSFEAREAWYSWNRAVTVSQYFNEGDSLLAPFRELRKRKNRVEYERLKTAILDADINQKPLTIASLREKKFSELAVVSWIGRKEQINRGLDTMIGEVRAEIIAYGRLGEKPPPIVRTIDGVKHQISLQEAIKMMGDSRDYYSPRNRHTGRLKVFIKNKNGNDVLYFADSPVFLTKRIAATMYPRSKGYSTAEVTPAKTLSEDVFEDEGKLLNTQQIVNNALEAMIKQTEAKLGDFDIEGKWETTKDGKKVFTLIGPYNEKHNTIFKRRGFKGRFYEGKWHFPHIHENVEKRIATALGNVDSAYLDTQRMFAGDLAVRIANTFEARGFLQHRIGRTEAVGKDVILGFEPDPIINSTQYVMGIAGGTAKKIAASRMMKAFSGTDISWEDYQETTPKAKYIDYVKMTKERGISASEQGTAYAAVKKYMVENLRNSETMDRILGTFKGLAVLKYLGFRIPSAFVNLTVLGTSLPATMHSEAKIPLHKTYGNITKAAWLYKTYLFGDKSKLADWQVKLFDEIRHKGWHQAQFNKEAIEELQTVAGRGFSHTLEFSMYMFGVTEQLNRVASIAGTYLALNDGKGGALNSDNLELSHKVSDLANGRYGKETHPVVLQGKGMGAQTFKMFYVFSKFSHTYLQNMFKMAREGQVALSEKDYKEAQRRLKSLSYMMFSPAVLGGVAAIPGWGLLMLILEKVFGGDDPEEALYEMMEENFGETVENVARFGLPGAGEHGITIKHSLAIDMTEIPTKILELGGAPASVVTDIIKGVDELSQGHYGRFMEHAMPSFAGRPFKAHREVTEGVRTRTGSKVFVGREQIKADALDTFWTATGWSTTRIAKLKDKRWHKLRVSAKYSNMRQAITELYKDYMTLPKNKRTVKMWEEIQKSKRAYNMRAERKGMVKKLGKAGRLTDKYLHSVWERSNKPTGADIRWN